MSAQLDSSSVADYLAKHPHFFAEHTALLGKVQLSSPLTGRAISLQERQMEVMREKYKALELRLTELLYIGEENDTINKNFHTWTCTLLKARKDADLPHILIEGMREIFSVPFATLRLWDIKPEFSGSWFTENVNEDTQFFAKSLTDPYCGPNNDFEAVRWLEQAAETTSTVIMPLRTHNAHRTFGLLILGSADAERFTEKMATDFLKNIGETASAALACLLA